MTSTPEQLTKLPICPVCKKEQLTNEEVAMTTDPNKRRCWFCLVEALVGMGMEISIPEPAEYGRPQLTKEDGIAYTKQRFFRTTPTMAEALAQATMASPPPTGATPGATPGVSPNTKPILSAGPTPLKFNDTERKEFVAKFGVDPIPKNQPFEIVVHGANEDTYLKFGCPYPIDLAEQQEIKRIMSGVLDIWGKLLKFGPQFAGTLVELQAISPEMFIGGRGR